MKNASIHEIASHNILSFLEEGRLTKGTCPETIDGKYFGNLLYAAAEIINSSDCPTELMPLWLAKTTVVLFDTLYKNATQDVAHRYGQLIGKWGVITDEGWYRVLSRYLGRLIDQALDSVPESVKNQEYWPAIKNAASNCKRVIQFYNNEAGIFVARAVLKAREGTFVPFLAKGDIEIFKAAYAADAAHRATLAYDAAYEAIDTRVIGGYLAARIADRTVQASNDCVSANAGIRCDPFVSGCAAKSLFNALLDEIEKEISIYNDSSAEGQNQ